LLRGLDHTKDQSYVLFGVPREQLGQMLLPIGGMHKTEVRRRAQDLNMPVFNKPDSQEICFVPDNDYAGFVERRRPGLAAAGSIVDSSGRVVGEHQGQHRFTIGQRRGVKVALGHRIYITGRDASTNTVRVGSRDDLAVRECTVGEANWLIDPVTGPTECLAMYRYNSTPVPARVEMLPEADSATHSGRRGRFRVEFASPQEAVAPGQAMVLYGSDNNSVVVGGGWIE
jgi:tRNA-specific 2-thiouridylase